MSKVRVLINPNAGTNNPLEAVVQAIARHWDTPDCEVTFQMTHDGEDGRRKAERAVRDGMDTLLVAGGDGMINTVGHALLDTGVALIKRTKTHRNRLIPLSADVVAMLRGRKEQATDTSDAGRVFTRSTGQAIDSGHAAGKFLIIARRLGLRTEGGGRPSLHSIRHTVATMALRAGYSDAEVAMMLGHSRASTVTAVYLHTNMERMRGMVEAAAPESTRPKLTVVRREGGAR